MKTHSLIESQNLNNMPAHARRREHLRAIASEKRLGRILRAARRAFIVSNSEPILARAVLERAYPRLKQFTDWQRWSVRRALLMEAEVIGRMLKGRGRPNLWAPKNGNSCDTMQHENNS
jgi:hypothetical protein